MTTTNWPFTRTAWAPPPWVMRGNMLTVWYEVSVVDLADQVDSRLLPASERTMARARLYSISASTAAGEVAFDEVVLAFTTVVGGVAGEVSYRMWTDSPTYQMWGREVYGWPLERCDLAIPEAFWSGGSPLVLPEVGLTFDLERVGTTPPAGAPSSRPWITPRRRFFGGTQQTVDEVLLVRPTLLDPGTVSVAQAGVSVESVWPSATFHDAVLTTGFVLDVGWDVTVMPVPQS